MEKRRNPNLTRIWLLVPKVFLQRFDTAIEDLFPSRSEAELKDRREWARAAAYIGQVINSISREYDSSKILAELEELKRMMAKIEQSQNKKGDGAVKGGD